MKQPNILLKVAAVASSLLLGGCFVSYRAGAFNWLTGTSAPAEPATSRETPDGTKRGSVLFGSTKSDAGLIVLPSPDTPAPSQQSPPTTTQPAPTILSGSKSMMPIVIPSPNLPGAQPPAPPQPSRPPQ